MWKFFNEKILNGQSRSIISAAAILAFASMASRFLGLIRDRMLAGRFGAGDSLDIYYAAFRIPDTVFNLLVFGALSAGFVPVFVHYWQRDSKGRQIIADEGWHFANSILNLLFLGLLAVAGLFFVFAPFLVKLITPGFGGEKLALTIDLTRIMFLSPLFLGASAVFGGILQSLKRFFIFSISPIFYNLGIIFGILFLVPRWGVYGLAFGVVAGAFLHLLVQFFAISFLGYQYKFSIDWRNKGVQRVLKMMGPRVLALAANQLNFLAITIIASGLVSGSLAIFDLTYNIWSFPLGIMASSLATAAFPTLARKAAQKDWMEFKQSFSLTLRQILFLIIPSSVLFIVLRAQIVRVILGAGKFNWEATISASRVLEFLSFCLFSEALVLLLVRAFFAFEDTKTPFWIQMFSSGFRIFFAWFFSLSRGAAGLALGFSVGSFVNLFLLWIFLRKKTGDLDEKVIFQSVAKIALASFAAAGTAYGVLYIMAGIVDMHKLWGIFLQGFVAGVAGILVYCLAGMILRLSEMVIFWNAIKNCLPFKSVEIDNELIQ